MSDRMTRPEAVTLCRLAKAACPQQQFDEYTPDAWYELLRDLRFEDCKEALFAVVRRTPFVAPAEIRAEVRRVRYDRLDKFGPFDAPPGLADNLAEWQAFITATNQRICDGELTREQWDEEQRALGYIGDREPPALEGVFRKVDDEGAA